MKLNPITPGMRVGIGAYAAFAGTALAMAPFSRYPSDAMARAVGITIGGVIALAWLLFRSLPKKPGAP